MNNRKRRLELVHFWSIVRNITFFLGLLGFIIFACGADSEHGLGSLFVIFLFGVFFIIISMFIEKYMIQSLIHDDICLNTIFTWSGIRNINIDPDDYKNYCEWLTVNKLQDTDELYYSWENREYYNQYLNWLKNNNLEDTEENYEYWEEFE